MASWITIILFFTYLWGLGFTVSYWMKKADNFLERQFMNIGVGMGVLSVLAILFNFLHIILDWKLFLGTSLAFPMFILVKKLKNKELVWPKFKLNRSDVIALVAILIAIISFYVYAKGAFTYSYL